MYYYDLFKVSAVTKMHLEELRVLLSYYNDVLSELAKRTATEIKLSNDHRLGTGLQTNNTTSVLYKLSKQKLEEPKLQKEPVLAKGLLTPTIGRSRGSILFVPKKDW